MSTPRFFCETCGAQVPLDVDLCPECGSKFTSVKCPRCEHEGTPAAFATGCPSCGFQPPRQRGVDLRARPSATGAAAARGLPNAVLGWLVVVALAALVGLTLAVLW